MKTSIYICADATLTYGPYGGRDKIVPQALPVCVVDDEHEAERLIGLVGRKTYHPIEDPDFAQQLRGRPILPGYGPRHRYHYSLPNFQRENVDDVFVVQDTMEALRDAIRAGDSLGPIFEKAGLCPECSFRVGHDRRCPRHDAYVEAGIAAGDILP